MFAKASEGTTFTDITYPVNRAGAIGVGMHIGAYHFARPAGANDVAIVSSAVAQADHFVDVAQPKAGDLPPVLDLEANGGLSPTNAREVDAGMGRRGHGPDRSPRDHLRRRRASGRPRSATRRASQEPGIPSGSRIGRRARRRSSPLRTGTGSAGRSGSGPRARWCRASRNASTQTERAYADRRRVRDQGLSRRLAGPQHTADDRRHGPGRKQARRRAGHLERRQAGRLQLPVAEL